MRWTVVVCIGLMLVSSLALAHLCNDVFAQAKDNLAVKVDIRDGQLRVNQTASFRVYLLNTMDRGIASIQLEIDSAEFDADVKPSKDWKEFPALRTVTQGGTKEYFAVNLTRKSGTPDGKYTIGLRLLSGQNRAAVFKAMDINDAMATMAVPKKPAALAIDGQANKEEWENALLCASFYEYRRRQNVPSDLQTRVRFSYDQKNLYCLLFCPDLGTQDVARIYVARDHDSAPEVVTVDLKTRAVFSSSGAGGLLCRGDGQSGSLELQLPLEALKVSGQPSFFVNLTRERDHVTTYLRGNSASVNNPIVYGRFVLTN